MKQHMSRYEASAEAWRAERELLMRQVRESEDRLGMQEKMWTREREGLYEELRILRQRANPKDGHGGGDGGSVGGIRRGLAKDSAIGQDNGRSTGTGERELGRGKEQMTVREARKAEEGAIDALKKEMDRIKQEYEENLENWEQDRQRFLSEIEDLKTQSKRQEYIYIQYLQRRVYL